jgi:hypothetical protein
MPVPREGEERDVKPNYPDEKYDEYRSGCTSPELDQRENTEAQQSDVA